MTDKEIEVSANRPVQPSKYSAWWHNARRRDSNQRKRANHGGASAAVTGRTQAEHPLHHG